MSSCPPLISTTYYCSESCARCSVKAKDDYEGGGGLCVLEDKDLVEVGCVGRLEDSVVV